MTEKRRKWQNYLYTVTKISKHELIHKTQTTAVQPGIYYPKDCATYPSDIRKKRRRAVFKNGDFNIEQKRSSGHKFSNYFLRLVETRWRWTLMNIFCSFILVWLFFALIYWIISLNHGDFNWINIQSNATEFTPCIKHMYSFTSAFLFSIEIQSTVAYGRRSVTQECPETIIAMCFQCIMSSVFQSIVIGILFAKLTRPMRRTKTILFSKNAVVNLRNDHFCLIFRVGDMRKSKIINIKPNAYIVRFNTECKEMRSFEQIELKLEIDECESTFFLWPVSVIHVVDETSPLYGLSAPDLLCCELEVLVVFEGIIESTGQPVQARTSYTEHDILWGHRFSSMVTYSYEKGIYNVDFSKLSEIHEIDTPLCSAREYNSILTTINCDCYKYRSAIDNLQ